MIINDFYIVGIATFPNETDTPLIVYANTMLPGSIAFQFLWRFRCSRAGRTDRSCVVIILSRRETLKTALAYGLSDVRYLCLNTVSRLLLGDD